MLNFTHEEDHVLLLWPLLPGSLPRPVPSLEDLWLNYRYYPSYIADIRSMNDGEHYTVAEGDAIVRYAYATGEMVDTVFSVTMTNGALTSF